MQCAFGIYCFEFLRGRKHAFFWIPNEQKNTKWFESSYSIIFTKFLTTTSLKSSLDLMYTDYGIISVYESISLTYRDILDLIYKVQTQLLYKNLNLRNKHRITVGKSYSPESRSFTKQNKLVRLVFFQISKCDWVQCYSKKSSKRKVNMKMFMFLFALAKTNDLQVSYWELWGRIQVEKQRFLTLFHLSKIVIDTLGFGLGFGFGFGFRFSPIH